MAIYLLDTGVIIDVLNQREIGRLLLGKLLSKGHLLACCLINVTETYAGMRRKEEGQTEALLQRLRYYPVTFAIARLAGLFKRDYSKKGQTLSIGDTIIAAVAIHHGFPLITDNTKDFPMKQLQLHTFPQA